MSETVTCDACGFQGQPEDFHPTASAYSDLACPTCGSTNNEHNSRYFKRVQEAVRSSREREGGEGDEPT